MVASFILDLDSQKPPSGLQKYIYYIYIHNTYVNMEGQVEGYRKGGGGGMDENVELARDG